MINLNLMIPKFKIPFFSLGSTVFSLFCKDIYKMIMVLRDGNKS